MDLGTFLGVNKLMERHMPASRAKALGWYLVKVNERAMGMKYNVWISENTEKGWSHSKHNLEYRFEDHEDAVLFKLTML